MADINEIRLSGTIHKLYRLKTKAGKPFAKVLLKVGKDTFWVLGYGNVVSAITSLKEGDPLAISGTARMNNWKDEAGVWKNDFNAVAWSVEINGQTISYQVAEQRGSQQGLHGSRPPGRQGEFDYQGGPF